MKKKNLQLVPFLTLLIGLAASAMVFLPALKFADFDTTYTGLNVITGETVVGIGSFANGKLPFSFWALLAFLLPVLAGVAAVAAPKGVVVSVVLFALSAVLIFTLPAYTKIVVTILGNSTVNDVDWVMQSGSIIAGTLSIAGAFISTLGLLKK